MKEIYRNFEGKIGVDNQYGYIISEEDNFYLVEFISAWQSNSKGNSVRIRKDVLSLSDFSNLEKIAELEMDILYGRADYGQVQYKGKWYSVPMIRKIQNDHQDGNWRKYV